MRQCLDSIKTDFGYRYRILFFTLTTNCTFFYGGAGKTAVFDQDTELTIFCYTLVMKKIRKVIRIIWVMAGISFFAWMIYSTQSRGFPETILESNQMIAVSENAEYISFIPTVEKRKTGFVFYPGAMIDPKAYAPMAHSLAENGYSVYIVKLPFRSASLFDQEETVVERTRQIFDTDHDIEKWVVGGHSRGGAIASRFAYNNTDRLSGLILIGTSHPKEDAFDLSATGLLVMKIYATQDGLASVSEVVDTGVYLPDNTIWVEIDGGNHAQFGYYGTQLGDKRAEISREKQQEITVSAILSMLNDVNK